MSGITTNASLLLLALVVFCGCKHRPLVDEYSLDSDYHWMSWDIYESWVERVKDPVFEQEHAPEIIYDEAEENAWRRLMVFYLFESRVRPGWTSREFGALFNDRSWIDGAQITPVFALGGQISAELPSDENDIDLVFSFIPFAKNRGASPGAITMCLGGLEPGWKHGPQATELAKAFLRGELDSDDAYLVEFAMEHPDRLGGCTERFTKRGHGLKPGW